MVNGFGELPPAKFGAEPSAAKSKEPMHPDQSPATGILRATVKLGPGGRVVIPAEMREAMKLKEGDTMLASLDDCGELRLARLTDLVRELHVISASYVPEGVSVVDEFIAERRAEAAREDAGT